MSDRRSASASRRGNAVRGSGGRGQGARGQNKRRVIHLESQQKRMLDQSRIRLLCVGMVFFAAFSAVAVKVVEVAIPDPSQIAIIHSAPNPIFANDDDDADEAAIEARLKAMKDVDPLRGEITDRNGIMLATSLSTASLVANPRVMQNKENVARQLVKTLPGLTYEGVIKRLKRDARFVYIKRNLTPGEQQAVNNLGIPGLTFEAHERRVYPYGRKLSHVLGYVDVDNKGIAGVEKYFDRRLTDPQDVAEPLRLSVDVRVQNIVYDELQKAMTEFRAIGATGVVMDVHSGEILAMANLPDFDPHRPGQSAPEDRFNRATLGVYEMGSTFKTFTAAMALDYGVANMNTSYDARNPIKVARFTISDTHPKNSWLSLPEVFAYSSNIGTVKIAQSVGVERQKAFLRKLGLMEPVALELPERGSPLWPQDWREINLMTISYGHGMAVTPMHVLRAMATLVGDGAMVRPTLIKEADERRAKEEPIVKSDTVQNVRRLLRLVVDHGTGSKANIEGYRVGGKTGTAEKVQASGYNADAKLTLFVSTFPVDQPKYAMLVILDEPKPTKETFGYATGGWTAAPVTGRIISRMGPLLGIKPEFDVPADDAEKFWVKNDPVKRAPESVAQPNFAVERAVHAVSY